MLLKPSRPMSTKLSSIVFLAIITLSTLIPTWLLRSVSPSLFFTASVLTVLVVILSLKLWPTMILLVSSLSKAVSLPLFSPVKPLKSTCGRLKPKIPRLKVSSLLLRLRKEMSLFLTTVMLFFTRTPLNPSFKFQ